MKSLEQAIVDAVKSRINFQIIEGKPVCNDHGNKQLLALLYEYDCKRPDDEAVRYVNIYTTDHGLSPGQTLFADVADAETMADISMCKCVGRSRVTVSVKPVFEA